MATKQVGSKFYVVKKNGKLGTRGYTSAANAQKAQSRGRALSKGSSPTGKSPKSSTTASSPAGGASTNTQPKFGVLARMARTLLNFLAPGAYAYQPVLRPTPPFQKFYRALLNYTGFNPETGEIHLEQAVPSYQGIFMSIANDWFDRKTRKSGKISRGKIVHIVSEGLPVVTAHWDARGTPDYAWNFYRSYNKQTTGYDLYNHDWDLGRMETYITAKGLAWVYDKVVPQSWKSSINSLFPKGVNPF